jgi:adenine-specific DNA methylase
MKKRLIEHNIPLADISEESAREKYIHHGHPSTIHFWLARRPLAASRATAFAALIDDPGPDEPAPEGSGFETKREYLQDLIKRITPWDAVKDGNSEAIEEARRLVLEQYGQPPKVLDPFAGGGSIPLETLRLGCETFASDYNPVAVFIEKATLEWPQKYGIEVALPKEMIEGASEEPKQMALGEDEETVKVNLLAYLVERWANIILEEARAEIGQFYPHESADGLVGTREVEHQEGWIPVGYLWARTIPCQNPSCGAEIPLIKQFWLAKKKNKKIAYRPVVDYENKHIDFEILEDAEAIETTSFDPGDGTVSRANARCPICKQVTKAKQIRRLAHEGMMGERMVAVVFHHPDQFGKRYRLATKTDMRIYKKARKYLDKKLVSWPYLEYPLPTEELPLMSGVFNVPIYGIDSWNKLFNSRQKLALITFLEKIKKNYGEIQDDCCFLISQLDIDCKPKKLARAVLGYLGVILDRQVDRSSNLARHDVTRESHQGTYARQALPMTWDYAEVAPFSGISSDWTSNRDWVLLYIRANPANTTKIVVQNASANDLSFPASYFDAILTDPPYYNLGEPTTGAETLSHWYWHELTSDKVGAILKQLHYRVLVRKFLGDNDQIATSALLDQFYKNPDLPVPASPGVVARAIQLGIKDGAFGLVEMLDGEVNPETLKYKTDLPMDAISFDPGTYLLTKERSETLWQEIQPSLEGVTEPETPSGPGAPGERTPSPPTQEEEPTQAPQPKEKSYQRIRLVVSGIPASKIADVNRGILLPLSRSVGDFKFTIELDVTSEDGLAESVLENQIKETIRQIGGQVEREELT